MSRKNWSKKELILAINLYCKTPFGKIHTHNPDIIKLSKIIGRSPGAVSYKLANFASIDPSLDRKGADHTSKLDKKVWEEFFNNWSKLSYESEKLLAEYKGEKINKYLNNTSDLPEGINKYHSVKTRVNQSFFRDSVLSSYNYKCCITGIDNKNLLIASHIIPWSKDKKNRTNPRNGLCLNALHDKAFDCGLITLTNNYTIKASRTIRKEYKNNSAYQFFKKFDGKVIDLPDRFIPNKNFLEYHRNNIFIK